MAGNLVGGKRIILLVSTVDAPLNVSLAAHVMASAENASVRVLQGVGPEPGYNPPTERALDTTGCIHLAPFAIALVTYS